MKLLNTIPTNRVVGIDIETVRLEQGFDNLSEEYKSAWEYKNKQDGEIPNYDDLSDFWEKRSSLYAEFSKVCAVSLTYLDNYGGLICKEFYGCNEEVLLSSLGVVLNNMVTASSEYRLAGHASKFFDYPFLCKRFVINNLDIPTVLDSLHLKPWEQKNLCTNELWRMGGTGAGSSLQALCTTLKIPISKVDLVGDEVGIAFYNKEYERIGRYCSYDTIATFNVIRRLKKESIFDFDNVKYITSYNDSMNIVEVVVKTPLLERIYSEKSISDASGKELLELLGARKKKILKKDKPRLVELLHKISVETKMFAGDKPEIVQEKLKVVEQLINKI